MTVLTYRASISRGEGGCWLLPAPPRGEREEDAAAGAAAAAAAWVSRGDNPEGPGPPGARLLYFIFSLFVNGASGSSTGEGRLISGDFGEIGGRPGDEEDDEVSTEDVAPPLIASDATTRSLGYKGRGVVTIDEGYRVRNPPFLGQSRNVYTPRTPHDHRS